MDQFSSGSYTVESLLERLALKGQQKIWLSFPDNIHVKGTVESVNNWRDQLSYITLEGSGLHVSLRCPYDMRPKEGEHIVFQGQATLKPSKFNNSGLEVQIIGEPVGSWTPHYDVSSSEKIEKGARVLLSQFLKQHPMNKLLIMGTNTALRDVGACFDIDTGTANLLMEKIRVADRGSLIEDMNTALEKHEPYAFAIVRGGDDPSLNIWDDSKLVSEIVNFESPFYLALGHSHRVTLADKYADETFHTPSDFGASLSQQYTAIIETIKLKEFSSTLKKQLEISKQCLDNANQDLDHAQQDLDHVQREIEEAKAKLFKTKVVCALAVGLAAVFIYYWANRVEPPNLNR